MLIKIIIRWAIVAMLGSASFRLSAAELGMPAPPLQIAEWLKGGPVQLSSGKGSNVYVVEFWATWCPPCVRTIPLLTSLQKKYKDRGVVIVGITDEAAAKAKPFVAKKGDTMNYVVAVDNELKTGDAYLGAFEENGIPHAFVVDKEGRIVWHGSPLIGLEAVLEQVVTGRFDLAAAQRAEKARNLIMDYYVKASAPTPNPELADLGRQIVDGLAGSDPEALDSFAWTILTHRQIQQRDVPLALRASKLAFDAAGGNDPGFGETYARALYAAGRFAEAVEIQKRALAATTDERARARFQERLQIYESKVKP